MQRSLDTLKNLTDRFKKHRSPTDVIAESSMPARIVCNSSKPICYSLKIGLELDGPLKKAHLNNFLRFVSAMIVSGFLYGKDDWVGFGPIGAHHVYQELYKVKLFTGKKGSKYLSNLSCNIYAKGFSVCSCVKSGIPDLVGKYSGTWEVITQDRIVVVVSYNVEYHLIQAYHESRSLYKSRGYDPQCLPHPEWDVIMRKISLSQLGNIEFSEAVALELLSPQFSLIGTKGLLNK